MQSCHHSGYIMVHVGPIHAAALPYAVAAGHRASSFGSSKHQFCEDHGITHPVMVLMSVPLCSISIHAALMLPFILGIVHVLTHHLISPGTCASRSANSVGGRCHNRTFGHGLFGVTPGGLTPSSDIGSLRICKESHR
jgi:hypothetical protein